MTLKRVLASCAAALLGASLILGPSRSALALTEAKPPADLPKLKSLSGPKSSIKKARQELLSFLYTQLEHADSEETADRIVAALEKLWTQSGSDTVNILMQRAGIAMKARNYTLATDVLTALTEVEPRYVEGWNQLATVYFMQENYAQAMRQLRHVLALDPRHFKAIEGLGIILRETGNKKAALKATRKALEINPYLKSAKQAESELAREVEGQDL
jgi:tetratricopeptide (TPR) repeat protein